MIATTTATAPSEWKFQRDLTAADNAVMHIVNRIIRDPDARWACGWATESFRLLCVAYADLVGQPFDDVEAYLVDLQARGKSSAEVLLELLDRNDHVSAVIREAMNR